MTADVGQAAGPAPIAGVHDPRPCLLGEGPLWHPEREQLFWFDITGNRLLTQDTAGRPLEWAFSGHVSAAGWLDRDHLLIASETGLHRFAVHTGHSDLVAALEADQPANRSNDGRADPFGGFWIGTMAKTDAAGAGAGAIYRLYRGELRRLFGNITIPNAVAFTPDGLHATFADTARGMVWRVALDSATGWPRGEPEVFIDFSGSGLNPDGAVFDAAGAFWCAHWGAGCVGVYDATGTALRQIAIPARHSSCPAFGGPDLSTLYCTSARQGLDAATLAAEPLNGLVFATPAGVRGQPEHRVIL